VVAVTVKYLLGEILKMDNQGV